MLKPDLHLMKIFITNNPNKIYLKILPLNSIPSGIRKLSKHYFKTTEKKLHEVLLKVLLLVEHLCLHAYSDFQTISIFIIYILIMATFFLKAVYHILTIYVFISFIKCNYFRSLVFSFSLSEQRGSSCRNKFLKK